jgi:cytosine permease
VDSDEFSTSPVPRERSIPWWKIALTNVLFSICLPTLITGLDLGIAAPRRYFLSGIIVGSLILTFIGILTSVLGSRTRLSSYMLARIPGRRTRHRSGGAHARRQLHLGENRGTGDSAGR